MAKHEKLWDGNVFDHRGYRFRVKFERDDDTDAPWENSDGHGIVSDWTTRQKAPGERVLSEDHGSFRYYDFAGTLQLALRDQWGVAGGRLPGESRRQYAVRAVEQDYEYLRAWCRDEWEYLGVIVSLHADDADDEDETMVESLWGVESYSDDYPTEVAYELADQLIARLEVAQPDVVLSEN
jgi:hypothetical protein